MKRREVTAWPSRRWHKVRGMGPCLPGSVLLLVLATLLPVSAAQADDIGIGLRLLGADGTSLGLAPQLHTTVSIRVSGMLARVRVQQRFRNLHDAWVEGVYVFPLPEDAAVDRLRMVYAERLIEGEIQERQQARTTYAAARARGQAGALVEQQRANLFTTAVANIPPGEQVRVEIEYQQAVLWRDGAFSLRFPSVVAPRYIPGAALPASGAPWLSVGRSLDTGQVPDASLISPPLLADAPADFNPLQIEVDLNSGLQLAAIDSLYHAIDTEPAGYGRSRVRLRAGEVPAERDFVLQWHPKPQQQPTAALFHEAWGDRQYALLMLMPPQAGVVPQLARELILVVDRSGSMHGASIAQARAALRSAIGQLRPGDRFNIVRFNHQHDALFERARPFDQDSLAQAVRYIDALHADGGTEILPALRFALRDPQPSGLLRQVVFLTDGAVGNEQAVFAAVAAELGDSRLFTVGIGSAPNALLMRRAAEFGRGSFTYIGSIDEVEQQVGALFRRLSAPVVTGLTLAWQGEAAPVEVDQVPARLPDLYAGEPLTIALAARELPRRLEISGTLGDTAWRHGLDLHGGANAAGVHVLWARRLIDDWSSRLVTGEDFDSVRAAVLRVALEHRLVSRFTSLVAVDRTPRRPVDQALHTAAVATRLPAGWSADAGRLPATATPAPLLLWSGLILLLAGLGMARRRNAAGKAGSVR